jgi:hypothetical protein
LPNPENEWRAAKGGRLADDADVGALGFDELPSSLPLPELIVPGSRLRVTPAISFLDILTEVEDSQPYTL